MHGHGVSRWIVGLSLLAGALGCSDARPQPPVADPPADAGSLFDPSTAGTITGRVRWAGDIPVVPQFLEGPAKIPRANPNAPVIGAKTRGVRDAVVLLRGVDPRRGRPWDFGSVRVVQENQQFHVRQGDADGRLGFVRRGDPIEMTSVDRIFHSLHAGGAAFFTLAFPDADRPPRTRRLAQNGVVELTSAAGYFWMRGYLFVDDHPYYARTDAEGRFTLGSVPPGRYEAVCWLPDWREQSHERDPETSFVIRIGFRPPLEQTQPVELGGKETRELEFELSCPTDPPPRTSP